MEASPAGQALLGPLINAKVELYSLTHLDGAPLFTTTTTDSNEVDKAGRFVIPVSSLDDNELYIVKVSGGQDIDADDDGTRDAAPTENKGAIHALLTGAQIRSGDYHVSILTEVLYRRLAYLLSAGYSKEDILNELDYRTAIALKSDITGDGIIDRNDSSLWQPRLHQAALRHNYAVYQNLQDVVRTGTPLGAAAFYPTDREIGALDLSGTAPAASAFGDGVAGLMTPTSPSGYKLQVIDIKDPTRPRLAGSLQTEFSGGTIAAQGHYFYVTNGAELFVIDAGIKDAPTQVGKLQLPTSQDFRWVSVSGKFAYLSSGAGGCTVIVVDIAQPEAPTLRGTITCTGSIGQSYYAAGRLYASLVSGIQIFDVSRPDSPVVEGLVPLSSFYPVYATATTAYLVDTSSHLDIVDIADANNPSIVRTLDATSYVPIGLEGGNLFADSGTSLQIYDLSAPTDPKLTASVPRISASPLWFSNGFAYQFDADRLVILDLRNIQAAPNPQHPHLNTSAVVDVTVDGDRAYLSGLARGVVVADISDPNVPRQLGTTSTPGAVIKTVVGGDSLYVNGRIDLAQVNIASVPGTVTGNAGEALGPKLALADNTLYAISPDGLRAYDVAQPDKLSLNRADYFLGSSFSDMSLNDARTVLCAAGADNTLRFISTVSLETIKALKLTSAPRTCRFHGNYVFVTTEDDAQIVDASAPDTASVVTHIALKASSAFLFNGDVAYVSIAADHAIEIYDVSDPVHPLPIKAVSGDFFPDATVRNGRIFDGNEIWDISDALNPSVAGSVSLDANDFIHSIGAADTTEYLITQNGITQANSLYIVDATDPTAPSVRSKTELPLEPTIVASPPPSFPTSIAVANNTIYVSGFRIGLLSIDVHDPVYPSVIASGSSPIFSIADIAAEKDYAFVADYVCGFHALDFTDPSNPRYYDIAGAAQNVTALALKGNLLYSVTDDSLQVTDISDPTHATLVGSVNLDFTIGSAKIAVAGGYAYVVGEHELRIVDVSDPAHPRLAGPAVQLAYHQALDSGSITINRSRLYVRRGAAGVEVINVGSPIRPVSEAVIPVPAIGTAAQGDYLYLAGENGLDVVKPMVRALP